MTPQAGEVWLADLGLAAKMRPVVIVLRSRSRSTTASGEKLDVNQNTVGGERQPDMSGSDAKPDIPGTIGRWGMAARQFWFCPASCPWGRCLFS